MKKRSFWTWLKDPFGRKRHNWFLQESKRLHANVMRTISEASDVVETGSMSEVFAALDKANEAKAVYLDFMQNHRR